jgi:indolepyruvate ferredoxin oxidoreductase alpha subunit
MHKLLTQNPGQKMLLLGNEAIARGAIEAGVAVTSTYPGTPSSEISLQFFQTAQESDLYFEYSTNEKVAMEVAAAAANSGVRSMCVMKHVGVNVAADALMTLAYVGVKGGMVVLTADDPYMFSSQNEQDNRFYAKLSGLPMLEPSSVEEAKNMVGYAFEISEKLQEPVLFRTTTRINHSSGIVRLGEIKAPKTKGDFVKKPKVILSKIPSTSSRSRRLPENYTSSSLRTSKKPGNFPRPRSIISLTALLENGESFATVSATITHPMPSKSYISTIKSGSCGWAFHTPCPKK